MSNIEQIAPTPWAKSSAMTFIVVDAAHNPVCTCSSGDDSASLRRDHIIACVNRFVGLNPKALPMLLEMCDRVLDHLEESAEPDSPGVYNDLRHALNYIRGYTQSEVPDA
jgi:hypothetical protein